MLIHNARELGLRIRDQRREMGLSQTELAKRIGVSRSWVVKMEQGNGGAAVDLVLRALAALGLILDVREADARAVPLASEYGEVWSPDPAEILDRARSHCQPLTL